MIVPSAVIILSNILVVVKLRAHMRRIPSSPGVTFNTSDTVYTTAGPTNTIHIKSIKASKASLARSDEENPQQNSSLIGGTPPNGSTKKANRVQQASMRKVSLRYQDLQLTRSLLLVTSVFILLNLPNYVYRIGIQFFDIDGQVGVHWY